MLSRFLSPDPFIQAPGLAISHNRYAYCMNNPFMYTDPTGYKWYEPWTWSLKRGWDNVWTGLDNFAKWADRTDWFPSSASFGTNVDNNGNWGYKSEVNGQETFNSRTNYDFDGLAKYAVSGMESRMPGRSVGSASYDPYSIEVNWIMGGDKRILDSFDGDLNVIPYSYYDNQLTADFHQRFSGRAEIVSPEFDILLGIGALRAFRAVNAAKTSSNVLLNTSRQLQAKFKHAGDFGVLGNYSKANAGKFSSAVNQHINSAGIQTINGTYRGQSVIHYLNPSSGLNVISSPTGQFISGWKLNPAQLQNVLQHGGL